MSITFETRSDRAANMGAMKTRAEKPRTKKERRANGTIAISAALLVTSTFIGLALILEHPAGPLVRPALRQSLIPPEFSCTGENCGKALSSTPAEPLRSP